MATPAIQARMEKLGVGLIKPSAGLSAMMLCMANLTQAPVLAPLSMLDWTKALRPAQQKLAAFEEFCKPSQVALRRPINNCIETKSLVTFQSVLTSVTDAAQRAMGGGMLEPDQAFMSAGLDSLSSIELRNNLETQFGISLSATVTFHYPSANALARFIHTKLSSAASGGHEQQSTMHSSHNIVYEVASVIAATIGYDVDADQSLMKVSIFIKILCIVCHSLFGLILPPLLLRIAHLPGRNGLFGCR